MQIVYRSPAGEQELDVDLGNPDATLGDLVAAVEGRVVDTVTVDDRSYPASCAVADAAVPTAATLAVPPLVAGRRPPPTEGFELAVVAGPDAGLRVALRPGRTTIGRSPDSTVVLRHRTVARAQCVLDLDPDGRAHLTDLGASNRTVVDGVALPVRRPVPLAPGAVVETGALALVLRAVVDDRHRDRADRGLGPGGGIPFNRPPRSIPLPSSAPLEVPEKPREADRPDFSITMIVAPLILAGVLIAATGEMRFALFALLSPVLGIGMYVEGRRRVARKNRKAQERHREQVQELGARIAEAAATDRARLRARLPDPAEVLRRAALPSSRLWERRRFSNDAFELSAGIADIPWRPELHGPGATLPAELAGRDDLHRLRSAPAVVPLARGGVVGIVGNRAQGLALARSLLCQAAVHHGPADVTIGVFVDDGRGPDWDWAKWLPHTQNPLGEPGARWLGEGRAVCDALLTDLAKGAGADAVLVVVDSDVLTTGRDSPARTVLQQSRIPRPGGERDEPRFCGIVLASTADHLPAACDTVIEMVDDEAGAVLRRPLEDRALHHVLTAGLTDARARACARDLARFEDPELHLPGAELPDLVRLLPLLSLDAVDGESVRRKWRAARVDGAPQGTVGVTARGVVTLDLDEHGPHGLVGGTTGSGKSELLRTLVVGLAAASDPRLLTFVLVDYKGGAAFDRCAQLPHTVGLLTDLDAQLGERALTALRAELHHRERRLREVGADNITAYRRLGLAEPMPRLVVVIDEFATLAKELPDFVSSLVDVAQRGRTLGVHLILATQRPSGAVNENIKANTNLRIALQMLDAGESKDIVDVGDAAGITRKGRALVRLSRRDLVPMQTALVTCVTRDDSDRAVSAAPFTYGPRPQRTAAPAGSGDDADRGRTDLDRLVDAIIDATALEAIAPPRRPWPEPLPAEIPLDSVVGGSVGGERPVAVVACADDPEHQDQYPVGWSPAEGNLLLLGVPGSGTTTTLASIALALAASHSPQELELQVLDFGVGGLAPLAGLPHVGSVVLAGDRERQVRLLRHVVAEFARRRASGRSRRLVVLVDNLPALRAAFDDAAGTELLAQFARVVADGQAAGISVVLTADRPQSVPTAFSTTQQWLFRLADAIDYSYAGIDRRNVPSPTPGRAVITGSGPHRGLHIQVARPLPDLAAAVAGVAAVHPDADRVAHTVEVLPTRVARTELGATARLATRPWVVPVGTAESDLGVAALQLYDEEHALVAGPARSGRSTALWTIAESLRHGDSPVHLAGISGPRSPLRDCPALDRHAATPGEAAALVAALRTVGGPIVLLVDDADRFDDGGALDLLFTAPVPGLHVIAAGNNDGLRTLYGHWTKHVRAARSGLLLRPNVHMDGDLLGTVLPGRAPVEMVTGRGYLVTNGEARLVQVAVP